MKPLILEVKGNSLDDGPGIRSIVFFKGCPLDCVWCHNPESKKKEQEISHDAKVCIGCNACMETCPENAISPDHPYFIDRDRCTLCHDCIEACPSGAVSRVGLPMTVDLILEKVLRDKPFFDASGGGVTLSGGEPTIDINFTATLMQALKKKNIHILLETCGMFNTNAFMEKIYPHADAVYFDIKLMDPVAHQKHCGVDNDRILKNFIMLNHAWKNGGIEVLPRTPLVPGITDTVENISAIADFYRKNGVTRAALLDYNPLWHEKTRNIGVENPLGKIHKMSQWLSKEKQDSCRRIMTDAGIEL